MIIVHTCTIAIGHFRRGSGGRSPLDLQGGLEGARPPNFEKIVVVVVVFSKYVVCFSNNYFVCVVEK